jgi:hypothetical protein
VDKLGFLVWLENHRSRRGEAVLSRWAISAVPRIDSLSPLDPPGSRDGGVRVWDAGSGAEVLTLLQPGTRAVRGLVPYSVGGAPRVVSVLLSSSSSLAAAAAAAAYHGPRSSSSILVGDVMVVVLVTSNHTKPY